MENQNDGSGQKTINIQIPPLNNITSRRSLIPASFAIAIICFFFTFCNLNCGGQIIGSVTGINLVTGTELGGRDMFSGRETKGQEIPANIWAIFAFVAAISGLIAFLMKEKREARIGTGAGAIGVGSLIILQFVIKSAIDEKAKGAINVDFQFPYWGALIALAVAGIISYLRIQKTNNVLVSVSPPSTTTTPLTENISQPQTTIGSIPQTNNFDIVDWLNKNGKVVSEWFNKNKKVVIIVVASVGVLYGAYYFFLKNDPVNDAKNAASAFCDCSTRHNEAIIKVDEEFVKSFDTYGFKKRQEARNKLQELQYSVNAENSTSYNTAQQNYNDLRKRYIAEQELLGKFDFAYSALSGTCNPSNQIKLTSICSKIENKINSIKDPEPDIEKIKSDLIGQQIPGWRFAYLNEYKSAEITNTTRGNDRVEYQIKFHLIDNSSNSEHDCEVITVYLQGGQGWYFNNIKMVYITYTNTAPLNNWYKIEPLQNCRYSILDQGHRYWAFDGGYVRKKYMGGPNTPAFTLTTNDIYIMSRESQPVNIVFKYFPNN
ncbi:MAG: hypothetical protein ABSA44_04900 [Bacteroidota bacterium]|jgi:hypothetical protein